MSVNASIFFRQRGRAWRGLLLGLVLLLPLTQLGATLHALSHAVQVDVQDVEGRHDPQHGGVDLCDTCLAFSHLATADAPDVFVPPLLAGLAFARGAAWPAAVPVAELPSLHNRGPPAAL